MTSRLLGGKDVWSLAHKMKKLSLDKTEDVVQLGEPRSRLPQVCYFGAFALGLDKKMNVDIVRIGRGLGQLATDRRHHMGTAPFPYLFHVKHPCGNPSLPPSDSGGRG